jgi:putative ABC transport system permease protein
VTGRRRPAMDAMGATPRQLSHMIKVEAMTVGLLATVAAIVPGGLLGEWLFNRLTGFGVVPPVFTFHQGVFPAVAAILIGLCTAWCAAVFAGRYARRTPPIEAMREMATPARWLTPVRLWLGVSCLLGAAVSAYLSLTVPAGPVAASTAGPAVTCVAAAIALFAPASPG